MRTHVKNGRLSRKQKIGEYIISVDYADYASPTFNERVNVLLPLFNSRAISVEKFVDELWANVLTEEKATEEIERIKVLSEQTVFDEFGSE